MTLMYHISILDIDIYIYNLKMSIIKLSLI